MFQQSARIHSHKPVIRLVCTQEEHEGIGANGRHPNRLCSTDRVIQDIDIARHRSMDNKFGESRKLRHKNIYAFYY